MEKLSLEDFETAYMTYQKARLLFLKEIGCDLSNRDPLAEASEYLVALLTNGQCAPNRVQKDYDVIGPSGERIQVKYLANPLGKDINGH